jgi:hypothetical protein
VGSTIESRFSLDDHLLEFAAYVYAQEYVKNPKVTLSFPLLPRMIQHQEIQVQRHCYHGQCEVPKFPGQTISTGSVLVPLHFGLVLCVCNGLTYQAMIESPEENEFVLIKDQFVRLDLPITF